MDSLRCGGSILIRTGSLWWGNRCDRSNAAGVALLGAKQVGPLGGVQDQGGEFAAVGLLCWKV